MAKYTLCLSKKVQVALDALSDHIVAPILAAIERLGNNPHPAGCKKLSGRSGYRIRVGNYRVIYTIEDNQLTVTVIAIGHRKDVYRIR
ncbi:RelE/StbE family addiction module toxin [Bacteroidia bacterium]|nr:RelE/StbE family addiction module toxin [Bacteroidia bacterium]